jgi:hypothetical protein
MVPAGFEGVTDTEGRFRVGGLLPGLEHQLTLSRGPKESLTAALTKPSARSGETRELGDIQSR